MIKLFVKKNSVKLVLACIIFSIIIIVFVALGSRCKEISSIRKGEFESYLWNKYPDYRYYMVNDMEIKTDIWNLTQDEIIEKLGTYDMNELVSVDNKRIVSYVIKRVYGIIPWSTVIIEYYHIKFTDDGRVENISVYEGS